MVKNFQKGQNEYFMAQVTFDNATKLNYYYVEYTHPDQRFDEKLPKKI